MEIAVRIPILLEAVFTIIFFKISRIGKPIEDSALQMNGSFGRMLNFSDVVVDRGQRKMIEGKQIESIDYHRFAVVITVDHFLTSAVNEGNEIAILDRKSVV